MVCLQHKAITKRVALFVYIFCDASILVTTFTINPVCQLTRLGPSRFTHPRFYLGSKSDRLVPTNNFESTNDHDYYIRLLGEQHISQEDIRSWSTKKLLRALDRLNIRYLPTASRVELEDAFLTSNRISIDYLQRDEDVRSRNSTEHATEVSAPFIDTDECSHSEWKERQMKRAQRRQKNVEEKFLSPLSFSQHRVVQKVPRIVGTIVDGVVRKARRWKRHVSDVWALDDETGVRDVRYEYIRRETFPSPISPVEVVPEEHIDVLVSGTSDLLSYPPHTFPPLDKSKRRRRKSSAGADGDLFPSRRNMNVEASNDRGNDNVFLLPPGSGHDERYVSHDVPANVRKNPRRRPKGSVRAPIDKKVYNPYGSPIDDEKDVVDRISEFLSVAADRVMWGMFDEASDVETSPQSANTSSHFDSHDTPRDQERSQRGARPFRKPSRHWKDRMEERLDSLLGLHQDGDFYRSWTERFEREKKTWTDSETSVSTQGRQSKRRRHAAYTKPFWEETGSIFSLLFGRSEAGTGRPFDDGLGFEAGSMLSIFRLMLRSFLIVASYLCRWASTQGALPQPVVVFGVSSAVLCARPHRRLMVAGIALLLLRTVGEVLHGYVHGTDGWENEEDFDNEDDSADFENARDGSLWDD